MFTQRLLLFVGSAILMWGILNADSLFAQQGATITGKVISKSNGEALPGCNLVLSNLSGDVVAGTSTKEEGLYTFKNLAPGVYILEASFVGYGNAVEQFNLSAGEQKEINFELTEVSFNTEAIVVTAGRRAEKISEASANIQVVPTEEIEMSQEPTVFGMMKNVPGIDYFETGMGQQQINARGFTSPFTGNMLVLVDYRLTTLPGIGGNLGAILGTSKEDISRIEVIVGPNSALYGANAGSGVVNIITKQPKGDAGHSFTLAGGNHNMYRAGFRSSELINKYIGYKISGNIYHARDFESYVNPTNDTPTTKSDPLRDDPDFDIDNYVFNGSLFLYPNNTTTISYTGGYANANYINQSNIGRLQVNDFRLWYHQVRINFDNLFGLGSMFLQGYYTADDAGDTYSLEDSKILQLSGLDKQTAIEKTTFVDKPKRYDLELQHNFNVGLKNFFTWGVQYRKIEPNSEGTFLSDGPNGEKIEIEETGAYAQYENEMLPNVRLTLTGRYDNSSEFGDQFSPKVGISYGYQGHNFRVTYNEAFGSPPIQPAFARSFLGQLPPEQGGLELWLRGAHAGFTLVNVATGETRKIDKLHPTTTKGFEFGYKGNFGNRFLVDITGYSTKYQEFISSPLVINDPANGWFVVGPDGQPLIEVTLSYINFGEVTLNGIDVGGEWLISPNTSISAAYSYADLGDFTNVPSSVSATPSFNTPFNKAKGSLKLMNWGKPGSVAELSMRYVDSYQFVAAQHYNTGRIKSYVVFDLTAEIPVKLFEYGNTRVGINIKNLFDNKHRELPGGPELGFLGSGYVTFSF